MNAIIPVSSLAAQAVETAATSFTQPPAVPGVAANNVAGARTWDPKHDDHLRECFAARMTGSETAASLNHTFKTKYSRNAVIGRAHRLKLRSLNPPMPRIKKEKAPRNRNRKYQPKPPPLVFKCDELTGMREADVVPRHIGLLELEPEQCRWPYGDGPFTFCGHPVLDGSYCFEHQSLSIGTGTIAERTASNVLRWGARAR